MIKKRSIEKLLSENQDEKRYLLMAALTLVGVALIQLALAASYLAAFHAPKPNQLQIAIVGEQSQVQTIAGTIESKSSGSYMPKFVAKYEDAVTMLQKQSVYAIYAPAFPSSTITIASANSKSVSQATATVLETIDASYQQQVRLALSANSVTAASAAAPIVTAKVTDLAPLPAGDSSGLALFYVGFSAVFGGYLVAVALNLVRGKRAFTRRNAYVRTAGFAVFSIVTSLFVALIATHGVHAMASHDYWAIAGVVALTTFGVSMLASSLISLLGIFGTASVILLFVVLGTPASGGTVPVELTGGGPWHVVAPYLPTGASVGALRQVVYFEGVDVMRHLLVPIIYSAIGLIGLLAIGSPKSSISAYEKEIADELDA